MTEVATGSEDVWRHWGHNWQPGGRWEGGHVVEGVDNEVPVGNAGDVGDVVLGVGRTEEEAEVADLFGGRIGYSRVAGLVVVMVGCSCSASVASRCRTVRRRPWWSRDRATPPV